MKRRTLLIAGLAHVFGAGLIFPGSVSASYPAKAFRAKQAEDSIREFFGTLDIASSEMIEIETPPVADNREMVPIKIRSLLKNTESISIVIEGNETPFTAHFRIHQPQAYISTRVRAAGSGELLAIVKADGILHTRQFPLRIGAGMCRA